MNKMFVLTKMKQIFKLLFHIHIKSKVMKMHAKHSTQHVLLSPVCLFYNVEATIQQLTQLERCRCHVYLCNLLTCRRFSLHKLTSFNLSTFQIFAICYHSTHSLAHHTGLNPRSVNAKETKRQAEQPKKQINCNISP